MARMLSYLSCLLIGAVPAAHGQDAPKPARDMRTYANAAWRWSLSYPAQWTLEASDPAQIRVRFAERNASCSLYSGAMDRFNNVDELTEFILKNDEQIFKERKQKFGILERKRITLPNRLVANDVLAEIGPGQRSRRIYALVDGRGFAIDCETDSKNWENVEADYQRIVASFTVRR